MPSIRRLISSALILSAGSAMAVALPSPAGATPSLTPVPQYIIHFKAIALPATTTGLQFHSTSCAIGPAIDPIVVVCKEAGTIRFTAAGGSGSAYLSSALTGIEWKFSLVRGPSTTRAYRMVGRGAETVGGSPVVRPVKVTGTLTVEPTPDPTIEGTEYVYPIPVPAA